MSRRNVIIGICIFWVLGAGAVAVPNADAQTTAFTCSKDVTTKTWSDAHCLSESGTKEYGHVAIAPDKTTTITGVSGTSKGIQKFRWLWGGINIELQGTSVSGSGSMHNATVGGKMQATGTGTITYTNVEVVAPVGKGCKVSTDNGGAAGEAGVVHTNELRAVTTEEMGVKVEPVAGAFATFFIVGCAGSEALESLNKTYEVTGSVIGTPNGGEITFEHTNITAQNTLKISGVGKAGLDGSVTFSGRDAGNAADPYKALTATTPEASGSYRTDEEPTEDPPEETTAFTCSDEATTKEWKDPHCTVEAAAHAEGVYGHAAVQTGTQTTSTVGTGTGFGGIQKLRATINGINTELQTTTISGSGSMHNATVGGKMRATGTGTITYTGVEVVAPAGKGCKVSTDNGGVPGEAGVVHANELKAETTEEMGLKIEPAAGETFGTFLIEGCKGSEALEGLNKTYSVTGSVIGEPSGAEAGFTHAGTTAQNTLKINGSIKAGMEGSLTFKGKDPEVGGDSYKALAATTVPAE